MTTLGPTALPILAVLFIHPLKLPPGGRLWMLLPLALCIALVYRVTRSRSPRELLPAALYTFANIVVGMVLIAVGLYAAHELVLRFG